MILPAHAVAPGMIGMAAGQYGPPTAWQGTAVNNGATPQPTLWHSPQPCNILTLRGGFFTRPGRAGADRVGVPVSALILGVPGDAIAVVLGLLMFGLLFLLLEGIDRI